MFQAKHIKDYPQAHVVNAQESRPIIGLKLHYVCMNTHPFYE